MRDRHDDDCGLNPRTLPALTWPWRRPILATATTSRDPLSGPLLNTTAPIRRRSGHHRLERIGRTSSHSLRGCRMARHHFIAGTQC